MRGDPPQPIPYDELEGMSTPHARGSTSSSRSADA